LTTSGYSVYLLQGLFPNNFPRTHVAVLDSFIKIPIVLVVAHFTYRYVEKPAINLGKRINKRMDWRHSPLKANGQAALVTSAWAVGSHTITAVYGGSATHAASTSPVLTQAVNKISTSLVLVSSLILRS
jgi:hypothetical protein